MSFLSTLKALFSRPARPQKPAPVSRPKDQPRDNQQAPSGQPSPSPRVANSLPPATGPTSRNVRVAVYYRQRGMQKALYPAQYFHGPTGAKLTFPWPVLPGYELVEITGYVDRFPQTNQVIYLLYEPHLAAPVTVYHRDEHGRLLTAPQLHIGPLNASFTAHALADYPLAAGEAVTQQGHFTKTAQTVRFRYQLRPELTREAAPATYVELLTAKPAYATPNAPSAYRRTLPLHSFWRVFSIAQSATGEIWLDLGGSLWITADLTMPQDTNPYLPAPATLRLPDPARAVTFTPIQQVAVVDTFSAVSLWTAPYETVKPDRLAAGSTVQLIRLAVVSDGSQWYQLSTGAYVQGMYLDLTEA